MRSFWRWCIPFTASILLCNCDHLPPPPPAISTPDPITTEPWFVDEAEKRGITFAWESGAYCKHHMPEIIGGGVAMLDVDGDDDLDIYFIQGGSIFTIGDLQNENQLFINNDGVFTNETRSSGAGDTGFGMGIAVGDVDNDGDLDLYITNFGKDTLLINSGDGTFVDGTKKAGFVLDDWSTSAVFLDFDKDGDLDLFVSRYLQWSVEVETDCGLIFSFKHDYCAPLTYNTPLSDLLFQNNGDGTFTDVSRKTGISSVKGYGLGIGVDDFNGDGLEDIFVANDMSDHHLWINKGNGHFINEAGFRGCARDSSGTLKAGMGTEIFDVDFDGDPDILVVNMEGQEDSLFINDGNGYFVDGTGATGLIGMSKLSTRFGVLREDFNNDGHSDIYMSNGRISRAFRPVVLDIYAEQNNLFAGDVNGIMKQVLPHGGTADELFHTSRAAASGDIDSDGRLDIVVVNRDAPAYLLHNVTESQNFVELDIRNTHGSPAIGAIVHFIVGQQNQRHRVRSARSYFSSVSPIIHVGLGDETEIHDVTISWPSGTEINIPRFGVGRWTIEEPTK